MPASSVMKKDILHQTAPTKIKATSQVFKEITHETHKSARRKKASAILVDSPDTSPPTVPTKITNKIENK